MGLADLGHVVAAQWLVKSGYEILVTPATYAVVGFLKKAEQEDYYDRDTNFSPFRIKG